MSPGEIALGFAFLLVVGALGFQILRGGKGGELAATAQAGPLKWSLKVTQQTRQEVEVQLEAASEKTGKREGEDAARARLSATRTIGAGRVLWVDDHPDNNVEESLMLAGLGFAITQASSTETALRYLRQNYYEMLITDLGRGDNPAAGLDLLEQLPADGEMTTIVYTMFAGERAARAMELGATAVVETPGELLKIVLEKFALNQ